MKGFKAIKAEVEPLAEVVYWAQQDPYTFICMEVNLDGKIYTGYGFSKRNPRDESDPTLGRKIAVGRAIHQIACQVWREQTTVRIWADSVHVDISDLATAIKAS